MIPVLSRAETRKFDAHASAACEVPSLLLMENAGRGAADLIARELCANRGARVVVVCGAGNNGGDGFVVARRLLTLGFDSRVYLLVKPERLTGDTLCNYRSFLGVGGQVVELEPSQLRLLATAVEGARAVVDAVFGTGLDREITGFLRYAIEFMNGAQCPIFALDTPSGIDADTGAVLGVAVRVVVIAGSPGKIGAALLTARGALRAGAGLVTIAAFPETADLLDQRVLE